MNDSQSSYYSIKEVAVKLDLSERYVNTCINKGTLPALKAFSKWYISHDDLQKFIFKNGTPSDVILSKRSKS